MKQSLFIKLNKKKWEQYERRLNSREMSADELSKAYIHLTEDFAFSKARYPDTDLTAYLSRLALDIHNLIYKNKPESKKRFFDFWKSQVPQAVFDSRHSLLYSLLILLVGSIIGAISANNDETFIRLILGDAYVDMTVRNIESGKPMGIYSSMGMVDMFFFITTNNIKVSFLAFVSGVATSLATGFVLIRNGIMLGAFHALFYQHNLFDETILTIWIHGTIEISAIIIAGGAGITMGNRLLFPGTYPRAYSFRSGALKGVKIALSLMPFFIVAGFLESFVTRNTHWPLFVKIFIIAFSFFLISYYYIFLPHKTNNNASGKN